MSSDLLSNKNYHHDPASGSSTYNGSLLPRDQVLIEQLPRPMTPCTVIKAWLREAFPNVDENVIDVVLVASGGLIEPAFHALLGLSPAFRSSLTELRQV